MKKHLLFAAMLAMCAAPAVATPVANQPIFAADEAPATLATEAEYNALVKTITDYQAELTALLAELDEKYPLDKEAHKLINATLTGDGSLADILEKVKTKYAAGELTKEDVEKYQATIALYKEDISRDKMLDTAASDAFMEKRNLVEEAAGNKISEAEEELPSNIYDYFTSVMDSYGSQIQNAKYDVLTEEQLEEYKKDADALVAKAIAYAASAETASQLVKDLKATLPNWTEQIQQVETELPDYDTTTFKESLAYWKKVLNALTDYCEDPENPYTAQDFQDMSEEFGYYVDQNLYNMAMNEEWGAQYMKKYQSVSEKISAATATLDAECPSVAAKYMTQLEDLSAEMTKASQQFDGTVTKEEFDKMMARVDEIYAEVDKILEKAKAEQQATGINGITINDAVKSGKAYTLDGKRAGNAQKGIVVVNGKKIILNK